MSLSASLIPGRNDPEQRLIKAAQSGDQGAFDALVRAYAAPLRGFLARRIGSDAADDVLQETWVASWAALESFRGQARFKAWLYGIAQHKCMDYLRREARGHSEELSEETRGMPEEDDAFAASDRAQAVRAALSCLPESQQEVLDLYFYAELTLPEIAHLLGRNLNTVKYHFYRAHVQAAAALQEYAP